MRRKDRERDRDFALQVIDDSSFGVLGMCDEETPYTLPLSIVREGDYLYFHSARAGKKVDTLGDEKEVSISFVSYNQVPHNYSREEIKEFLKDNMAMGSKIYTTEFSSAHVQGRATLLDTEKDKEECKHALNLICEKYTPDYADLAEDFIEFSFHRTAVYKLKIREIAGKAKFLPKIEKLSGE